MVNYYESRSRKFAVDIFLKIKARILDLAHTPQRGRIVPELERQGIQDFRELIEGNYRILYSIKGKQVAVHSVIDSRRNLEEILFQKILDHFEK